MCHHFWEPNRSIKVDSISNGFRFWNFEFRGEKKSFFKLKIESFVIFLKRNWISETIEMCTIRFDWNAWFKVRFFESVHYQSHFRQDFGTNLYLRCSTLLWRNSTVQCMCVCIHVSQNDLHVRKIFAQNKVCFSSDLWANIKSKKNENRTFWRFWIFPLEFRNSEEKKWFWHLFHVYLIIKLNEYRFYCAVKREIWFSVLHKIQRTRKQTNRTKKPVI